MIEQPNAMSNGLFASDPMEEQKASERQDPLDKKDAPESDDDLTVSQTLHAPVTAILDNHLGGPMLTESLIGPSVPVSEEQPIEDLKNFDELKEEMDELRLSQQHIISLAEEKSKE